MKFPEMVVVRRRLKGPRLSDPEAAALDALRRFPGLASVEPGQSVAVTAGSRGIADIAAILRGVVRAVAERGAAPFVVPAMGSHGGATAEGQRRVLESYGITESFLGAPIRSSMETVNLGETAEGIPAFTDRLALGADRLIAVNRIKWHTDFSGKVESGLLKMLAIGLGKRDGARACHQATVDFGYERTIRSVARLVLGRLPLLCGVAILENGAHETAGISAVPPERIESEEMRLLRRAKGWMARLPVDRLDLLIVDEMGKDVSGPGMDTKVIGRLYSALERGPSRPRVTRIFVRDLTPATGGNATGIGLADFTTARLLGKIDPVPTRVNSLTGLVPEDAKLPIGFDTDQEAIATALETVGRRSAEEARVIRIRNTLALREIQVSKAALELIREPVEVIGDPAPMAFDGNGNLPSVELRELRTLG